MHTYQIIIVVLFLIMIPLAVIIFSTENKRTDYIANGILAFIALIIAIISGLNSNYISMGIWGFNTFIWSIATYIKYKRYNK